MTPAPTLSVVVVSHGRAQALARCLTGLWQMDATPGDVEVIVVADTDGLTAARALPFAKSLKTAQQSLPHISKARNDGVSLAAGDVVAFIDDDAIPEPTWASAIQSAFARDRACAAATGPVLGRNGISTQWGAIGIDATGMDQPMPEDSGRAPSDVVRKLHGTNMAVRRDLLLSMGGFDGAFAFYLDDTDLAWRLGRSGQVAQWCRGMVVHHGFAPSVRRTQARVPLSLFDIGASSAVYLRKHAPGRLDAALHALADAQRQRLLRLQGSRAIGADDMLRLMQSLRDGMQDGRKRAFGGGPLTSRDVPFLPMRQDPPAPRRSLSGWTHRAAALRREAAALTAAGTPVDLFLFEPTPRKHSLRFTPGGWWEQRGGLYGPSDRNGPRFQLWRFSTRLAMEQSRIRATRFAELSPGVMGR